MGIYILITYIIIIITLSVTHVDKYFIPEMMVDSNSSLRQASTLHLSYSPTNIAKARRKILLGNYLTGINQLDYEEVEKLGIA